MSKTPKSEQPSVLRKSIDELAEAIEIEAKERTDEIAAISNRMTVEETTRNNQITTLTNLVGANSLSLAKMSNSQKTTNRKVKGIINGTVALDGIMLKDDDGNIWEVRINKEKGCLEIVSLSNQQKEDSAAPLA